MDKVSLRKTLKQQRNAFSADQVKESSRAVVERLLAWEQYQKTNCLMVYLAFGQELDLDTLLIQAWSQNKKVYVPYILSSTEMQAVEITNLKHLKLDGYGIRTVPEPLRPIAPEELELILVPGVAFSRTGNRMGMGAGFYDRFLPKATKAIICGIAYKALLQEELPTDEYDVPMSYIVHEDSIFQTDSKSRSAK